jgi:stearoyl-CoA desaturase (delta-9 desaturase)
MEVFFFPWLFIIKPCLTYTYLGGMGAVAWTIAVPMVAGWHSTFLVNSAAHVWGRQPYETGEGLHHDVSNTFNSVITLLVTLC